MNQIAPPTLSRRHLLQTAGLATAAVLAGCAPSHHPLISPATTLPSKSIHRILTCNILFDLPEQKGTPFNWAAGRRTICLNLIRSRRPDIVCMQEVGRIQNDDFTRAFTDFVSFGYVDPYVDKRPIRFQSIKNVILFSKQRYDLISAGTYWLSLTPQVPGSRLPGEGLPRHLTWLRLRDRHTSQQFRVANTHWGLKQPTRLQEAPMIAAETQVYSPDFPQLLCGDFNSDSTSPEHQILHHAGWQDTYAPLHGTSQDHPSSTTHPAPRHRIDYIYSRGPVKPLAAEIFRPQGPPASDHPFVSADIEI
ncbi:MAG TPA: endonuclease/exonuclease/phosphatase family protein [Tepidisphaeraceae bacterium]|jgi:endonuclease/exonuclease/phosphatase family metal-dependent hydrolase|nr:endonuclease/exonuclease/phosphatase family protein [Tepidisphaeraceae bacterium]